jgi:hypothetical protein
MKKHINKYILFSILVFLIQNTHAQNPCVGANGQVKWSYWLGFEYRPDSSELKALESFPSRPSGSQMLGSLKSPKNFAENFASMIRGYIYVPTTETYKFNITSDDGSDFYLSTNDSPLNKKRRAGVRYYTGETDHNWEAGQTSQAITLTGGQNYYFEIYNYEGGGGDHVTLFWRKPSNPDTTWRVIDYNNIKEYVCGQNCPVRGTACNDGNPLTTDDKQDGFCNCVGKMPTANACVGDRGVAEAYYYDNITGGMVEPDLINAPRFPLQPHRKEKLNGAFGPLKQSSRDDYGTYLQGFLTVPVTGTYEFNITGDNQTFFFLSKNDSVQYKQTHQTIVFYGIGETEHNNSVFQNTGPLLLEKGKYYYYEFRHKENGWRDHFNLFWKTPFHENKDWKRVSNFYLYDYKCEIACIPAGTPCDDGNAFTNNDQYNSTCQCVGTPCTPPNCNDAGANYVPYDPAASTKNLVSGAEYSWLSCNTTNTNPNTARTSLKHWIRYDLGDVHKLQGTRVWNYNVATETTKGFKNVYVDYSMDGTTWTQLGGTYQWQQAPGLSDYSGFSGPNFNNQKARYVLISAVDNWGGICSGFSKLTLDAQLCSSANTACDDKDPLTFHDRFDANCNCGGVKINCDKDTILLGSVSLSEASYKAKKNVNSQSVVPLTKNISFTAGNDIVLMPGFEVKASAVFSAKIEGCLQTAFAANEKSMRKSNVETDSTVTDFGTKNEANDNVKRIIFRLNKPGQVKLSLKDASENLVVRIIDDYYQNLGTQIKMLPTGKLEKGDYWVELEVNGAVLKEKIVVN